MNKDNNYHNSGGFFFGVLIGIAGTLLVTTKKGRKILKAVTQNSMEKLGDWEDLVKNVTDVFDEDTIEAEEYTQDSPSNTDEYREDAVKYPENGTKTNHGRKRLFRGIPKKA